MSFGVIYPMALFGGTLLHFHPRQDTPANAILNMCVVAAPDGRAPCHQYRGGLADKFACERGASVVWLALRLAAVELP
jgi:hypothetical protein